ncbi:MAG: tetratricopeptide repeat protein [Myxococcota bacterium]
MDDDATRHDEVGNAPTVNVEDEPAAPPPEGAPLGLPAGSKDRVFSALFEDGEPAEQTIGRFQILGRLGRGGMGTVLEAYDDTLDRKVAIKHLHEGSSGQHQGRMLREAQALARLSHPNVVQVFETGEADGRAFIAMELVAGQTLAEWQQTPHDWRECLAVYLQAGRGLAAAHAEGIVHRDFKPANCIIDDAGHVKVLDFGLARGTDDAEGLASVESPPSSGRTGPPKLTDEVLGALAQQLTQTGTLLGTPAYMAPEQLRRMPADARADQFSFCVSLYEALFGVRPFDGMAGMVELMVGQRPAFAPEPTHAKLPPVPKWLRRVLLRGMDADKHARFEAMDALLAEVHAQRQRRRQTALAGTAVLVLAGAGGIASQFTQVAERCEGAAAQLEGIWDDTRRGEVQAAIVDNGGAYGADTWERIEPRLDDYAHAWVDKHTEVCEATRVSQQQTEDVMSLRMGCLSSARIGMQAAVGVLARITPEQVSEAIELVSSLGDLTRCDDVEALERRRSELPPPEDAEVAEQVEEQRGRLEDAAARGDIGDLDGAEAITREVIERAEALSYGPLQAEALLRRATLKKARGEYEGAIDDLEQTLALALQHGHRDVQFNALALLTAVVGDNQGDLPQGQRWGAMAQAMARHSSADSSHDLMVSSAMAQLELRHGRFEESLAHFEYVAELEERLGGPEDPSLGETRADIGTVLIRLARLDEAQVQVQRALEIGETTFGSHHPKVARQVEAVANVLARQGKLEQALPYYRRTLAISEENLGPEHPQIGGHLNNIAAILLDQGESAEALGYLERALAVKEKALGAEHIDLASTLKNIARAHVELQQADRAEAPLLRALAIEKASLGDDHFNVAHTWNIIGIVRVERNQPDEALEALRRAVAIIEGSQTPRHPMLGNPLINIGNLLRDQGELDEAAASYERALAIDEEALGPEHPHIAMVLIGLAETALLRGDVAAARTYSERNVSLCEAAQVPPADLAQANFLLARALWPYATQRPRARELATKARDIYAEHGQTEPKMHREVEDWLAKHPG